MEKRQVLTMAANGNEQPDQRLRLLEAIYDWAQRARMENDNRVPERRDAWLHGELTCSDVQVGDFRDGARHPKPEIMLVRDASRGAERALANAHTGSPTA